MRRHLARGAPRSELADLRMWRFLGGRLAAEAAVAMAAPGAGAAVGGAPAAGNAAGANAATVSATGAVPDARRGSADPPPAGTAFEARRGSEDLPPAAGAALDARRGSAGPLPAAGAALDARRGSAGPPPAPAPRPPARRRASGGPSERLVDGLPLLLSRSVCDFELFGAVHHFGSLSGGHYMAMTAVAPAPGGESGGGGGDEAASAARWHLFDDARVVPLERPGPALDAQVASGAAYILFYVRRDIAAGWRAALAAEAAAAAAREEAGGIGGGPSDAPAAPLPPYSVPEQLRGHSDAAAGEEQRGGTGAGAGAGVPPLSVQQLFPLPPGSAARRAATASAEEAARVLAAVASPELPADGVEQGVATTTAAGGAVAGGIAAVLGLVPGVGRMAASEAARGVVNAAGEACSAM